MIGRGALALALLAGPALGAGPPPGTGAPPGAASCSGCHALSLKAESSVPPIHGRPAGELAAALAAFRTGARPATVMNRIAPGFSEEESRAIAAWLSEQPAPR